MLRVLRMHSEGRGVAESSSKLIVSLNSVSNHLYARIPSVWFKIDYRFQILTTVLPQNAVSSMLEHVSLQERHFHHFILIYQHCCIESPARFSHCNKNSADKTNQLPWSDTSICCVSARRESSRLIFSAGNRGQTWSGGEDDQLADRRLIQV